MRKSWAQRSALKLIRWYWNQSCDVDFEEAYVSTKELVRYYEEKFYGKTILA